MAHLVTEFPNSCHLTEIHGNGGCSTHSHQQETSSTQIPCACVGDLLPPEEGIYIIRDGVPQPLPRYDTDEITKIL